MLDGLTTVPDVVTRWRPLSTEEAAIAGVLIEDANDKILSRWPDMDQRLISGDVRPATVKRVVAGMVRRAMMNRDVEGVTQQTDVGGPFTQSSSFANPTNNLYLTAEDIRDLSPEGYFPRVRQGWLA